MNGVKATAAPLTAAASYAGPLPPEVVVGVLAMGNPDVGEAETTGSDAVEEHVVTIAREARNALVEGRIDGGSQVHGLAPWIPAAGASRDPDVVSAYAAR